MIQGLNTTTNQRYLQAVIPQSSRYEILGYLLTHLTSRISASVLSLVDITEIESNRLTELLRLVYPLESLFGASGGAVEYVGGWLKFCYIAEILVCVSNVATKCEESTNASIAS